MFRKKSGLHNINYSALIRSEKDVEGCLEDYLTITAPTKYYLIITSLPIPLPILLPGPLYLCLTIVTTPSNVHYNYICNMHVTTPCATPLTLLPPHCEGIASVQAKASEGVVK